MSENNRLYCYRCVHFFQRNNDMTCPTCHLEWPVIRDSLFLEGPYSPDSLDSLNYLLLHSVNRPRIEDIVFNSSSDVNDSEARPSRTQDSVMTTYIQPQTSSATDLMIRSILLSDMFQLFLNPENNHFTLNPFSAREIELIPTAIISQEHLDNNLQCVICLENFIKDQKVKKLLCRHLFHEDCIGPWLKQSYTCPICRRSLRANTANL